MTATGLVAVLFPDDRDRSHVATGSTRNCPQDTEDSGSHGTPHGPSPRRGAAAINHFEEVRMKRVCAVFVGALVLSALPALAQADAAKPPADAPK